MSAVFKETVSTDVAQQLPDDVWMVRPCDIYKEEYQECKSIRGRFHHYYVYGTKKDCSFWYEDWKKCQEYQKTNDASALNDVIEHEKQRRAMRIHAARSNDAWEYRKNPPAEWDSPLQGQVEKVDTGLFEAYDRRRDVEHLPPLTTPKGCVIL